MEREEHPSAIHAQSTLDAYQIPTAFLYVELQRKAADVAFGIGQ